MDDEELMEGLEADDFEQDGPGLFDEPAADTAPGSPTPPASASRPEAPAAPLALYRRYRPDTFAEVIGQEHVTEPLQRALEHNRVNHAYLFSGPRGCGKTTSARILARCLNCEQGPTPTPCGECQSCRDLATGGPGSIDVIEIDAASHGGVDDARDLRERAFFAPVASRYKIYIVDEAHMVTPAGFNALLKLVEEPPPHVKFIFATTEPEKVIGTIRSRTHHYPFRLVPPKVLGAYLTKICAEEGVAIEPSVVPLVVRAGAGSVRDSLSVLDQLLGGASDEGVTYAQATGLLGFTPDSLLDEICDAFAAGDAEGVFACVDKVIEVGQDPRRFAEDLLRRLRDLVVVAAVPDAVSSGLVDVAGDQGERLATQAAGMGIGELTRAAGVIANGLTEMRGTTAPRLHLELMCARVLLPGADVDERGIHARLERLERRLGMVESGAAPTPAVAEVPVAAQSQRPQVIERHEVPSAPSAERPDPGPDAVERGSEPTRAGRRPAVGRAVPEAAPTSASGSEEPSPTAAEPQQTRAGQAAERGTLGTADLRRLWPKVLDEVQSRRRFTWIMLSQNAQVHDVADGVLTLALASAGARDAWARGGNDDILRDALVSAIGADLRIETIVDGAAAPGGGRGRTSQAAPAARSTAQPAQSARPERVDPQAPPSAEAREGQAQEGPDRRSTDDSTEAHAAARPPAQSPDEPPVRRRPAGAADDAVSEPPRRRPASVSRVSDEPPPDDEPPPEDEFDPDSSDADVVAPDGAALLREKLGAQRIDDEPA